MAKINLYVFNLGKMYMDKSSLISGATLATSDNPNRPAEWAEFPITAFLIEHKKKGNILFDTGCNINAMGSNGRWSDYQQKHFPYSGSLEENLINQLKKIGKKPEEIDYIVISHLHNDHAGCIESFSKANVIVHEDEFNAAMQAYAMHNYNCSFVLKDVHEWLKRDIKWNFIKKGQDNLTLADGVTILNLGSGHSYGMLALHVLLENFGSVILASDAVYWNDNYYPKFIPPGIAYDSLGAKNAGNLKKLIKIPLTKPRIIPSRTTIIIGISMKPIEFDNNPKTIEQRAIIEPTERSIPPVKITTDIPKATTPNSAPNRVESNRLVYDKKYGDIKDMLNITMNRIMSIIMLYFHFFSEYILS